MSRAPLISYSYCVIFFFQAEDGIRDVAVTGVQTCALPISTSVILVLVAFQLALTGLHELSEALWLPSSKAEMAILGPIVRNDLFFFVRSEEHTSELQSRLHLVCRLLLEKKKAHAAAPPRRPALACSSRVRH